VASYLEGGRTGGSDVRAGRVGVKEKDPRVATGDSLYAWRKSKNVKTAAGILLPP